MRRIFILLILLLGPAHACLWSYEHDLNGQTVELEGSAEDYIFSLKQSPIPSWAEKKRALDERLAAAPQDYELRNDRAVALLHLGQVDEALGILEELEKEKPGLYITAANLGTAYELAGRNEDALRWISEGLKRNPESHQASEWVHVAILKAKLELAKDPAWLQTHTVLGYDFGPEPRPAPPAQLSDKAAQEKVAKALEYQLRERFQFIQPTDPTMADLLETLGALRALTISAEHSAAILKLALEYGPAHPERTQARLELMNRLGPPKSARGPEPTAQSQLWPALGSTVVVVLLLVLLSKRRRR